MKIVILNDRNNIVILRRCNCVFENTIIFKQQRLNTVSGFDKLRDKSVTEVDLHPAYNMRYFPQHVLLCTSTVHDQSGDICIQGYLWIL